MEMGRLQECICLAGVLIRVWGSWRSWKLELLETALLALRWLLSNRKPLFVLAPEQAPKWCIVLRRDTVCAISPAAVLYLM